MNKDFCFPLLFEGNCDTDSSFWFLVTNFGYEVLMSD